MADSEYHTAYKNRSKSFGAGIMVYICVFVSHPCSFAT